MAASSARDKEPESVATPPSSQTAMIAPNDGTLESMLLTLRKMPLPMIEPTTIITASKGPRTRGRTSTVRGSGIWPGDNEAGGNEAGDSYGLGLPGSGVVSDMRAA